jgi:hypothetical protein
MAHFQPTDERQIANVTFNGNDTFGEGTVTLSETRFDDTVLGRVIFDTPKDNDNYSVIFINPRYHVLDVLSKEMDGFTVGNDDARLAEAGTYNFVYQVNQLPAAE